MILTRLPILLFLFFTSQFSEAQSDSTLQLLQNLQQLPIKYINKIDDKIDKYSRRITGKTEKTLAKLSRWENKIQTILNKVNPEAVASLFGNNQTTFGNLLQKIKEGKTIAENYKAKYDEYRDKLTTSLKYLEQQKANLKNSILKPLNEANKKLTALEYEIKNTESVEQFIKERKKRLLNEVVKYIGKSKYLTKIDKDSYYYIETLRNYKEIFSDKDKAEEVALVLLNKIPAFKQFIQQNSILSSLFRAPNNGVDLSNYTNLQTRASVNALVQGRISTGGPNAQQSFSQNLQQTQAELTKLKDKVIKAGGNNSDKDIPSFKPNSQKSKTFFQRLEYGSNFQFVKGSSILPTVADIGLSIGYKLNDKSIIGMGVSYKIGLGSLQRIQISHQGISFRSYIDWKLKKQFFVSGGYEMNYHAQFNTISQLKNYNEWQSSGLIGLTKKINIKTKWFKGTKIQLLYDILYRQHNPVSQPVLFRIGYDLK